MPSGGLQTGVGTYRRKPTVGTLGTSLRVPLAFSTARKPVIP